MPTYAYACKQCGHRFETVQSFSEAALTVCPQCEGPLRKEYGSIGVTFNGSGFYRTDSRAGANASSGSSAPSSAGGDSGGSSTSSSPASTSSAAPAAS
jgi:putative FmdB family regulatory protein